MGRISYLSGKNGDLLDDPSSLFFQELLKDAVADSTCPNDSEFGICGHELYTVGEVGVNRLFVIDVILYLFFWVVFYLFLNLSHRHHYLRTFMEVSQLAQRARCRLRNKSFPADPRPAAVFFW